MKLGKKLVGSTAFGSPRLENSVLRNLKAAGAPSISQRNDCEHARQWVFGDAAEHLEFRVGYNLGRFCCEVALSDASLKERVRAIREVIKFSRDWLGRSKSKSRSKLDDEVKPLDSRAGVSVPIGTKDPVAAATSIVKSVSRQGVDWTREPATERERKIRTKIIEKILDERMFPQNSIQCIVNDAGLDSLAPRSTWPTDLRDAYDKASIIENEEREAERRADYDAVAREVDGLAAD
jgi:hypothetical protein